MALGRLAVVSGDERRAILEQAAELLIPLGNYREVAAAYSTAAYVALSEDRVAEATSLLDTALQAIAGVEDPWGTLIILSNLGLARLFSGDLDGARDAFEHGLRLCADHAFRNTADEALAGLAAVAAAQGRDEIAARLRGAAHALGTRRLRSTSGSTRPSNAITSPLPGPVTATSLGATASRPARGCRANRRSLTRSGNEPT